MFEKIKEICRYNRNVYSSEDVMCLYSKERLSNGTIKISECREEICPFMKIFNAPVKSHQIKEIEAKLERKEKKKVEPIDRGRAKCPVCGCHQLRRYQEYCGDCGQHLDWEVK